MEEKNSKTCHSTTTKSSNFQNFMRLQYLINTKATSCLRDLFIAEWESATGGTWENSSAHGTLFSNGYGEKLFKQSQKIQKGLLASGNLNRWDIPLLSNAIKVFTPSKRMTTSSRNRGLDVLKVERNKLAHQGNMEIDIDQFKCSWKSVTEILLEFGVPAIDLSEVRNLSFGGEEQNQKKEPSETTNPNVIKARELKQEGNALYKSKNYSEAILKYTDAINLPGLPAEELAALYSNRSISFYHQDDLESAKSDAKGAVLVHPTWPKGYYRLAFAYQALGKLPLAIKNYQVALGLDPSNEEVKGALEQCKFLAHKRSREEHLDPLNMTMTSAEVVKRMNQMGMKVNAHDIENGFRVNKQQNLPVGICAEAHRYALGIGCKQDYELAARCFARAASAPFGNAEGLYNLAILTMEGKGVRSNYVEAVRLLREAASQNSVLEIKGMCKAPNIGVAEAQHSLGLWHETGVGLPRDVTQAVTWYKRAIKNGMGNSCNNLALLYSQGDGVRRDLDMAIDLWKLGSYYKTPRAAENLAIEYLNLGHRENFWKWFDFAVGEGCISLSVQKSEFTAVIGPNLNPLTDRNAFRQNLISEIKAGPVRDLICTEPVILDFINGKFNNDSSMYNSVPTPASKKDENCYKIRIILDHRLAFQSTHRSLKHGQPFKYSTTPANISPKAVTDLFGLKPIFFNEISCTEDHIYEGYVIKLTVIEDAFLGRPSIPLIVEDENSDAQRVYIYNYPQEKDKVEETLGFGCKISILNPYLRIAEDGLAAIRVDDPSAIFFHPGLCDKTRCRFCGKSGSKVPCRKCKRCFYCSKKCLLMDSTDRSHELVCVKRI